MAQKRIKKKRGRERVRVEEREGEGDLAAVETGFKGILM